MARPRTKNDLIQVGDEKFEELLALIDSIPSEHLDDVFQFDNEKETASHWKRDKNIKDVLIHLYEWHSLLLNWIDANSNGINKQFLHEGYNWRTYGAMNLSFIDKHQHTTFNEAFDLLKQSHINVMALANDFSNEELFSKNIYKWVGGSTLGDYFVSSASSHYDWAIKKLKRYKKTLV